MKRFGISSWLLSALVLAGCGKPDPRIAELEKRVNDLDAAVKGMSNAIVAIHEVNTQLLANQKNLTDLVAASHSSSSSYNPPDAGTPPATSGSDGVDPATGLPLETSETGSVGSSTKPRILRSANRVTEQNIVWWRWAYSFTVGNPSALASHSHAEIKFMDSDGFIVKQETEYIDIQPFQTNVFTGYTLIDVAPARTVKKFSVELKED